MICRTQVFNSTTLDCTRKFRNFWFSSLAIRRLSDHICVENGLSIIKNPKSSKGNYSTWLGDKKKPANRDVLRQDIDVALSEKPKDFEEFLQLMRAAGYTIKQKKNVIFHNPKFKQPIRCNSLKGDYTEEAIQERIEGKRFAEPKTFTADNVVCEPFKVSLLIDIENSIKAKGSPGYEQWAKIFNLKQAAQTLIYLQENNLDEYGKLEQRATEVSDLYYELSEKMKPIEKRLSEINELQKHIGNCSRTRDIYTAYRKSGYGKAFLAEHEGEVILHQAAKKHFDNLGMEKLPTIKTLQTEYASLKSEKGKLYNEYRKSKDEMKKLATVKSNTDRLLEYSKGSRPAQKDERRK